MKNLEDLEKKINSELTTKINKTEIKHNQIYLDTDKDDLIDIFKKVDDAPKVFDVIVMSIGSTLISNHCALYVDTNRILHAMVDHTSWVSPYGSYYQQYTTGVYRWTGLTS